ncbi:MAG: ABC transporter permease, partial [Planctomycetes bacterium]|nr:ABC transporter permease [Planctomycetota bacterium]
RNIALYIFIAIPQAIVIATGGMNLSIGAIGGLCVVIAGYLLDVHQMNPLLVVPISLALGAFLGLLNGLLIAKLKLNSFIVTLSTMFLFTGFVYGISKGFPFTNIPATFTWLGRKGFNGVPYLLMLAIMFLFILAYILRYTVFGRHLLATGGNAEAARLSGISTDRVVIATNILSGIMAGVAGLLTLSRIGSAQPSTGQNWMIVSFAVSILGCTALTGGVILPLGLFMGGVVMVLIKNGLVLLEANVYYEQAFIGGIILVAVVIDRVGSLMKRSS